MSKSLLPQENLIADLSSISKNSFDMKTKIAVISFHNKKYSIYIEAFLLFVEYFQLFSQIAFIALEVAYKQISMSEKPLSQLMVIICQIFNPFYYVKSKHDLEKPLFIVALSVVIFYFVFKHVLFLYLARSSIQSIRRFNIFVIIGEWIFKLQNRMLYFLFSSLWIGVIRALSQDNTDRHGIKTSGIIIVSSIMIIVEYLYSMYLLFNYCNLLPTKNFLAEKDNYSQIVTLTQKFILQVLLVLGFVFNFSVNAWIFSSVCLLTDLLRTFYHFASLPLYNIKALIYQGSLFMIITSLDISWLTEDILKYSINYHVDDFIWISTIVLTLLTVKASKTCLYKIIDHIAIGYNIHSPHLLIHKTVFIKQIRNNSKLNNEFSGKHDFSYLIFQSLSIKITRILSMGPEFNHVSDFNIRSKESSNQSFLYYLENLQNKFPKDNLIKLYLADFYSRKMKSFGKAIKMVQDLEKSSSRLMKLNASLLVLDIQNRLRTKYESQDNLINLSLFVKSQSCFNEIKQKVLKQIQLKIELCEEIMVESPRLKKIIHWPQRIHAFHSQIHKEVKQMFGMIPDYFIEPIAFMYNFSILINHDISEAIKYQKLYLLKYEKYKKAFDFHNLKEENAYQSNNAFLVVSGQKNDLGTILLCTESIKSICGRDSKLLVGKNFHTLAVPTLQNLFDETFKTQIKNEIQITPTARFFGQHHEGYMVEAEYYINIYPFTNRTFCYGVILRQAKMNHDTLLINEKGDIEGATRKIQAKLGLRKINQISPNKTLNIRLISKALSRVYKEFSRTYLENQLSLEQVDTTKKKDSNNQYLEEDQNETGEIKAKDSLSRFTTKGEKLLLKSLVNSETYLYNCRVCDITPGSIYKIINLEVLEENDESKYRSLKMIKQEMESESSDESSYDKDSDFFRSNEERQYCYDDAPCFVPIFSTNADRTYKRNRDKTNIILKTEFEKTYLNTCEKVYTEASNLLSPLPSGHKKNMENIESSLRGQQEVISEIPKSADEESKQEEKVKGELAQKTIPKAEVSVDESRKSRGSSMHVKISNAFKEAVTAKSYPNYYWFLCILFYLVLAGVFCVQLFIKATWEDRLDDLKVKKDILNNALLRNYYSVDIPYLIILAQAIQNEKLKFDNPDLMDPIIILEEDISALIKTNNIMLEDTNSLSEDMRASLFSKDIRLFEVCSTCSQNSYIMMDSFQAVDSILEFVSGRKNIFHSNSTDFFAGIDIFYENCLNDFAIKNAEIVETFSRSLDNQREQILTSTKTLFILTLTCLVLNFLLMTVNLLRHNRIEKKYLIAVTKLNSKGLQDFLERLTKFKAMVENHENFEEGLEKSSDDFQYLGSYVSNEGRHKTENKKSPNAKGINSKYYCYFTTLSFMVIVLSGLGFWSTKAVQNFIHIIYEKNSQLYFMSLTRSRIELTEYAFLDLISNGNVNRKIENLPILTFLSNSIQEVISLRSEATKIFPPKSFEKDSEVGQIVYGDGCQLLFEFLQLFCVVIKDHGIMPSFVQGLAVYENLLLNFYEKFTLLDDAEKLLYKPEMKTFILQDSLYSIMGVAEPFYLIEVLNKQYEQILEKSKGQRNIIFGVFAFIYGTLAILFWILVLKDLKEVNNRFKRVLQVFPPHLILSNFYLKLFLIKDSKGALDFVKNGI